LSSGQDKLVFENLPTPSQRSLLCRCSAIASPIYSRTWVYVFASSPFALPLWLQILTLSRFPLIRSRSNSLCVDAVGQLFCGEWQLTLPQTNRGECDPLQFLLNRINRRCFNTHSPWKSFMKPSTRETHGFSPVIQPSTATLEIQRYVHTEDFCHGNILPSPAQRTGTSSKGLTLPR
jgi:hypothetical protein